jgi:hypothetical protein
MWAAVFTAGAAAAPAMPRFGRPGTYAVDGSPIGVRVAALQSSIARDLLTANEAGEEGPSLSFLFNRGSGSFFPEQRMGLAANYIVHAVAAGDFNADGRSDIALAVDDLNDFPVRGAVLVLLHNGSGFASPVTYTLTGFFPQCIEAVDVTGDGALDLVVCHSRVSGGSSEGLITVLGGQRTGTTPNGTFQQIYSDVVGTAPASATAGDVDGDGRTDLLVVDPAEQRVLILYGTAAAARFESAAELDMVSGPVAALANDVPGQPLPQVLVLSTTGGRLLTYRQNEARVFSAVAAPPRIALVPNTMGLADVDNDGIDDLIVLSALGVEFWHGEPNGTFSFGESLLSGNDIEPDALAIADLNGDSKPDVAVSESSKDRVTVVLNGADVPFTPAPTATITATPTSTRIPTPTTTRSPGGACTGNCNGDGVVSIDELITGVNIALGNAAVGTCAAFDVDGDGQVAINELIAGVNSAQNGCAPAT